jgi:hypothetical protein
MFARVILMLRIKEIPPLRFGYSQEGPTFCEPKLIDVSTAELWNTSFEVSWR